MILNILEAQLALHHLLVQVQVSILVLDWLRKHKVEQHGKAHVPRVTMRQTTMENGVHRLLVVPGKKTLVKDKLKDILRHRFPQAINLVHPQLILAGDKVLLADQTHLKIQDFNHYNLRVQVLAV